MPIKHHVANYVLGGAALALAGFATVHAKQPMLIPAAMHESVRASTFDWPGLGQDKTIALADKLNLIPEAKVTIYCSRLSCHELATDIDDAFQIVDWPRDHEERQVESEADPGISVGPPGPRAEAVAAAIETTTGFKTKVVGIDGIEGVGIIIGKAQQ